MRTISKTLVFILLVQVTFAQINIGVRGGLSSSRMTKFELIQDITPAFKLLPSANVGIFVEIPLGTNFSIQPELNYLQKGFQIRESFNINQNSNLGFDIPLGGKLSLKNNYIEMPLLAKVKLGDAETPHAYILFGPSFGYMIDSKARIQVLRIFPVDIPLGTGIYHRAEVSGIAGLGYEIPLKFGQIFFEGRFQHGLTRVLDIPTVRIPVRNQNLSLSAGISIALNR